MTIYLISPYEHITAVCSTGREAERLIRDHIGLHPVTQQKYERADAKLEAATERVFETDEAYLNWCKETLP